MRWKNSILSLVALATFLVPSFAFADACECFCGTVEDGGFDAGAQSSQASCRKACEGVSATYVGCFEDETGYPQNDEKCWTEEECDDYSKTTSGGDVVTGDWAGTKTPYCAPTTGTNKEMRFCYAETTATIDLIVDVGSMTEAGTLGEYVVNVYTWLIPAAALVAVVMMMIGGLQYAMARGKSAYIDKGKKRITNAIAGLVLLMSAYVITRLIDPRLVSFDALRTPLIKEVVILDPDSSCEKLIDQGFEIEPVAGAAEECGSPANKGTVESMDKVKENVSGSSWKVGSTCTYMDCPSGYTCTSNGCASCSTVPTPSASACNAMDVKDGGSNGDLQVICEYEESTNSCLAIGTDDYDAGINCDALRTFADSDEDNPGCKYYETLKWYTADDSARLAADDTYQDMFEDICNNDLCGVGGLLGCYTQYDVSGGTELYCANETATN